MVIAGAVGARSRLAEVLLPQSVDCRLRGHDPIRSAMKVVAGDREEALCLVNLQFAVTASPLR